MPSARGRRECREGHALGARTVERDVEILFGERDEVLRVRSASDRRARARRSPNAITAAIASLMMPPERLTSISFSTSTPALRASAAASRAARNSI
jgi:hypothetical protein